MPRTRLVLLLAALGLCACATRFPAPAPVRAYTAPCAAPAPGPPLEIRYLGAGGHLLRHGDTVILTAPFFSNPRFSRVFFGRIGPDAVRIDAGLAGVEGLEQVQAILAGHAHYDHLMDLPRVRERTPRARIFGNRTAVNLLARLGVAAEPIDARAASAWQPGEWIPLAGARVMPLRSEHAPHVGRLRLVRGHVDEPSGPPPRRARDWREGTTHAFLIDFLDADGSVAFRVHHQDTASNAPVGFPPRLSGADAAPVDVAITCVASFENVEGYPDGVVRATDPRLVVLGHWEDFFRPQDAPLAPLPGTDVRGFVTRLERVLRPGAGWVLPAPGARIEVPACEGER